MNNSLKDKVFSGVMWNSAARIFQQLIQFVVSVILARLLLPADFGAVSMILVFTSFAGMFADAGFGSALVQRTEVSEKHIQSVFWFNIATGLILSCAMFLSAPLIAEFYHEPVLVSLTKGLAPVFLISSVGMVPSALMQKRMEFGLLARISLVGALISGVLGIVLAYQGAGAWSLIFQSLLSYAIISSLNLFFCRWRPLRIFDWHALKDLWGFTVNLFGFSFINYWARNADNMLIGRYFGSEPLGYYGRAYGVMLLPINQVISVVSNVMFSALSSIKEDKGRVKRIYLRAIGLISLLTFPMMVGLFVTAKPFVLAVYGEKWSGMIIVLQVLSLVGIVQSLVNPTGWLYMSQGRTDWLFRWGVVRSSIVVGSIILGIYLGSIETVAICYAISNLMLLYPDIAIPGVLIGLSFYDVLKMVRGSFLGAMIMGVCMWLVQQNFLLISSPWLQLFSLTLCGIVVYGIYIGVSKIQPWQDAIGFVKDRRPKNNSKFVQTDKL